jgi:hypothetical protein
MRTFDHHPNCATCWGSCSGDNSEARNSHISEEVFMQRPIMKRAQIEEATLVSGGIVPRSGTYRARHTHPRTGAVTLLKGNLFPPCDVCGQAVRYDIVNWVSHESASARFRLLMNTKQTMVAEN